MNIGSVIRGGNPEDILVGDHYLLPTNRMAECVVVNSGFVSLQYAGTDDSVVLTPEFLTGRCSFIARCGKST